MGMYSTEGNLDAWLQPNGAVVSPGQPIAEISTEKTTFELEAQFAGILQIVIQPGTEVAVSEVMGYILAEGEEAANPNAAAATAAAAAAPEAAPEPAAAPRTEVRASPVAKKLAAQHNIDLATVVGTGPSGRIVEADILAAVEARSKAAAAPSPGQLRVRERIPLSGIRGAVADRMMRSVQSTASLTLTTEASADVLVNARKAYIARTGSPLPYDALFIKVLAAALEEHPALNAIVDGKEIVRFVDVNVGFAVPLDGGLIVPVIHGASKKSVSDIVGEIHQLRSKASAASLHPADVDGGTATVSNLGTFGIDAFTPILNPPQSCTLGIGRIMERPVCRDGKLMAGNTVVLSLTFDHRVTDGVPAAQTLEAVVRMLNDEKYLAGVLN
jgi:pyruvate dehydrogenase E2 component (dihydrolipoamide acetyltransferase)